MSLKFGTTTVTQVKFGSSTSNLSDVNKIVFNNTVAWCRPFTLTITKDTGVSSVTVTRTSAEEPTASTNVSLSSGATIYYNDKLSISASANSGYKLNSYDTSKTVTSNTTISITSTPILSAPSLSVSGTTVTIKNNNSVSVTMYSLRPYASTWGTSTLAAGASTTRNCEQDLDMAGQTSGTFKAYFKNDGYVQSSESSITVKLTQTTQDPLVYIKTFVPSITFSSSTGITISNFNTLLSATGTTASYWSIYILRFHQRNSRRINDSARGVYRGAFSSRKFRMDQNVGALKANSSGVVANTSSSYASSWVYKNCDDETYGATDYDNCFGVRIMPASKTAYDQCFSKYSDIMYYSTSGGYYHTDDIMLN